MEAGRSLGLTYLQTMRHVIMPQAIRIVIPPLGNETINLVLNSSLASAIGYGELTRQGKLLIAITFETFWTWGLVLLFYFSITYTLTNILKYAERKLKIPGLGLGGET
jgi:polar amino acid transport system permease protein